MSLCSLSTSSQDGKTKPLTSQAPISIYYLLWYPAK
jgi:hypothetical protein